MRRLKKKIAINGPKHWKVSISIQISWVDSLSRIYVSVERSYLRNRTCDTDAR